MSLSQHAAPSRRATIAAFELGAVRESNNSAIEEVCDQLGAAFDSRDAGADLSEASCRRGLREDPSR